LRSSIAEKRHFRDFVAIRPKSILNDVRADHFYGGAPERSYLVSLAALFPGQSGAAATVTQARNNTCSRT